MASRNLVPLLDDSNAAFIQGGVSMIASSRVGENIPVMARAVGCRVSADRQTVTLLFPTPSAREFLDGIRLSKQLAVVFSLPSTHKTIQLKGKDAVVVPAQKRDVKVIERYCDAFVANVGPFGYEESLIRALLWFDPTDLSAVTFMPDDAFLQTPGPRAGDSLKRGVDANTG